MFWLIVDSDSNRKMLRMLLKKLSVEADTAEDGREGVDKIMSNADHYQLVFMDNLMPIMVTPYCSNLIIMNNYYC